MKHTLEQVREDPIFQALNPKGKKFIEVRRLPLASHGVEVVALIPFSIFPHIKTVPAFQMMLEDFNNGTYKNIHTIVVPSSGNTAHAVARLARAFGFKKIKVVMSTDVPDSKKSILTALASVDVMQVTDVASTAREEAQKPGHYLLDQYTHMGNVRAHELYTGPEILRLIGDDLAVIAIAMGSGGTVAGVGRFLKQKKLGTIVLGVRPRLGEQVPGARDRKRMEDVVTLPWKKVVDAVVEVSRKDSFIGMRQLWSAVEPQPGPTSGLAWAGLEKYIRSLNSKELKRLKGKCVAFICPDDGRFYSERTTGELDPEQGVV